MNDYLNELKKVLTRLELEAKTLEESRQNVLQEMAEINCPFNVGDRLINRNNEMAQVAAISHWNNPKYKIRIRKVNADGLVHKLVTTAWESDQWELDTEVLVNGKPIKPIQNARIESK